MTYITDAFLISQGWVQQEDLSVFTKGEPPFKHFLTYARRNYIEVYLPTHLDPPMDKYFVFRGHVKNNEEFNLLERMLTINL